MKTYIKGWLPCFEDPPKTFTQDDVNAIVAEERKKLQTAAQQQAGELEALKNKSKLTEEERKNLETRIEQLRSESLTKEQQTAREVERRQKDYEAKVSALTTERDTWQQRFATVTIENSLSSAASTANAFNSSQVVAILKPSTKLVEQLEEGEPTGNLIPVVELADVDAKTKKPVILQLSPTEAVKRLAEKEEFSNLFKSDGVGGLGGSNRGHSHGVDMATLAKNPAAYRQARKEGRI